jgi:hypothetical protein
MTVLLTLNTAGSDTSIFDLYSDIDSFTTPFETDVSKASLLSGYSTSLCPDYATVVRLQAKGSCVNYVDVELKDLICYFTGVIECV